MLKNNQGFVCEGCNKPVPKAEKTCRNHCPWCFLSLHVDDAVPGDRDSDCQGVMIPTSYLRANGTIKITFCCVECGAIHHNKIAPDDSFGSLDTMIQQRKRKYPNVLQ